jgi:hypothetical protein
MLFRDQVRAVGHADSWRTPQGTPSRTRLPGLLAEKTGISKSFVSDLETGKRKLMVERNGESQFVSVDLVDTFTWLLGLTVKHIDVIRGIRVVNGINPTRRAFPSPLAKPQ